MVRNSPLLEPPLTDERQGRIFVFLSIFFRHKLFITNVFILVTLPILILLLFMPTQYLAKTKILINPTRTFLGLSPSGTPPLPPPMTVAHRPLTTRFRLSRVRSSASDWRRKY